MRIQSWNNSAKFHPDGIRTDEALGFLVAVAPTRTRWVATWDQVPDSVVTKAVASETEAKTEAEGSETEGKTEAEGSETEAEAQGSWLIF